MIYSYSRLLINNFESSWPNSGNVMAFLKPLVSEKDTFLTSEGQVSNLALPQIPDENFYSFWDFDYKGESGTEAYKWAIRDGYFTYIFLNKNLDDDLAETIMAEASLTYETLYTDESFLVLKHKPLPG